MQRTLFQPHSKLKVDSGNPPVVVVFVVTVFRIINFRFFLKFVELIIEPTKWNPFIFFGRNPKKENISLTFAGWSC